MSSSNPSFVRCIANGDCKHCGKPIENNSIVIAVGDPYSMLLHERCAPYYDYSKLFPHDKPIQFFRKI
jgi:hypothetical protein